MINPKDQNSLNANTPVLTCGQTFALEQKIADQNQPRYCDMKSEDAISGLELMARAGAACCKHVKSMMRGREGVPLILCGPGGNGGDGYVIARLLGRRVTNRRFFRCGRRLWIAMRRNARGLREVGRESRRRCAACRSQLLYRC